MRTYFCLTLLVIGCRDTTKEIARTQENVLSTKIESYVQQQMKLHEIPGMALAVIKNGNLIHQGYYGKASMENGETLSDKTVFKIFSLTKTMVATSVFKLIEEGKISLDDKLSDYFQDIPSLWKTVTIANLLSHSSGLPDVRKYKNELENDSITDEAFIRLLYGDAMDFKTGEEWSYNQTNYILLKRLIEKVTAVSFETYVLDHQFAKVDSTTVFFSSNPAREIPNGAHYYEFDKSLNSFKKKPEHSGKRNHPLAGLSLTLNAYIAWNNRLDDGALLNEATKKAMWRPFEFTNSNRKFLHGWDVYEVNGHDSFGFSGGGVSGYRKFLDKDLSIIVLTTGYKYYAVQDISIDHIVGLVDADLKDSETEIKEHISAKYLLSSDSISIKDMVKKVKTEYLDHNLEATFKSLGYRLFFELERKKDAITLFELNVLEYPESYDTHGSLAYLQFLSEAFESSRKNYIKALELNPDNSYSTRMIKRIDELTP